ncbi:MAG TPA: hypothetical protein VMD25_11030 [Acidobacteriaceae bacterium]|nr:hypothetical protein [Acidobacteriaceae bacterium]
MPSPHRILARAAGAAILFAFLIAGSPVRAQQPEPAYIPVVHRNAAQMDPADAALVRARRLDLATEAAFFGYHLDSSGWSSDQVLCPEIDGVLLHYRRTARNGAQSLFAAFIPRDASRVYVVPVLYHGATPFASAIGSERSLAVYNRAIPPEAAGKALNPDGSGSWLQLAVCYAEFVGAEPWVITQANQETGLVRAPQPTLRVSEVDHLDHVVFADRDAPGRYQVWDVTFSNKGRVLAASESTLADYVARATSNEELQEKPMPPGAEPKTIPLPAQSEPKTVPTPH